MNHRDWRTLGEILSLISLILIIWTFWKGAEYKRIEEALRNNPFGATMIYQAFNETIQWAVITIVVFCAAVIAERRAKEDYERQQSIGSPGPASTGTVVEPILTQLAQRLQTVAKVPREKRVISKSTMRWGKLACLLGVLLVVIGAVIYVVEPMEKVSAFDAQPASSSFTVNARTFHQIGIWLPKKTSLTATVHVSGGSNDVDLYVTGPSGSVKPSTRITSPYTFSWTSGADGWYYVYFDNSFSWFTAKSVSWKIDSCVQAQPVCPFCMYLMSHYVPPVAIIVGIAMIAVGLAFWGKLGLFIVEREPSIKPT